MPTPNQSVHLRAEPDFFGNSKSPWILRSQCCLFALPGRKVLDAPQKPLADVEIRLPRNVAPQAHATHSLVAVLVPLPSVFCGQNSRDLRVIQIRSVEISNLGERRIQTQLVHEAVPVGVIAASAVPDAGIPHKHCSCLAGGPDLASHMLVKGDLPGTHIAKLRARNQKSAAHLVRSVGRKQGQLYIEVVLAKIDHGVLMGVRPRHFLRSHEMSGVMVVKWIGTDEGVDQSLNLWQSEDIAEGRALWPSLFKGSPDGVKSPFPILHLLQGDRTQLPGYHFVELEIAGCDESGHLLRTQ